MRRSRGGTGWERREGKRERRGGGDEEACGTREDGGTERDWVIFFPVVMGSTE
jgi:hypothetical protein